ncbi:MAG TPA: peptidoglycan DD-metalloendopeptidase family protein [Candidatus Saccharimonadia bacterium]|nr:peptidoglycan DD-metalloendopeptidase family protein [Candidatus Saccharimonadia bacterium]
MIHRTRTHRLRALGTLLLIVPILLGSLSFGAPAAHGDELSDALARQKALQQRIRDQKNALRDLRGAETSLKNALDATANRLDGINTDQAVVRKRINEATAALAAVESRYAELVGELTHLDWTLGILVDELTQAKSDLAQRKRLLAQRVGDAYKLQQTSLLEQVLTADSLTDVLAQVGTYLRVGQQDADLAARIERDKVAMAELQRTTDSTRFRTEEVRQEVAVQADTIRDQKAKLEAARRRLDKLEAETRRLQEQQLRAFQRIAKSKAAAAALLRAQVRAQSRLSSQIDRIVRDQLGKGRIPSQYNGSLRWPMSGRVTQEFGCTGFAWEPPLGSCDHFHRGIDIVAPYGTAVHASGDGVVVFVGYNPWDPPADRAWIVIVAHSADLVTWYAHMQPKKPSGIYQGAHVDAGDVVGWEGNTGNSTGAHLHWAVQFKDEFTNPRLFL